jgi:hypothetical protein
MGQSSDCSLVQLPLVPLSPRPDTRTLPPPCALLVTAWAEADRPLYTSVVPLIPCARPGPLDDLWPLGEVLVNVSILFNTGRISPVHRPRFCPRAPTLLHPCPERTTDCSSSQCPYIPPLSVCCEQSNRHITTWGTRNHYTISRTNRWAPRDPPSHKHSAALASQGKPLSWLQPGETTGTRSHSHSWPQGRRRTTLDQGTEEENKRRRSRSMGGTMAQNAALVPSIPNRTHQTAWWETSPDVSRQARRS